MTSGNCIFTSDIDYIYAHEWIKWPKCLFFFTFPCSFFWHSALNSLPVDNSRQTRLSKYVFQTCTGPECLNTYSTSTLVKAVYLCVEMITFANVNATTGHILLSNLHSRKSDIWWLETIVMKALIYAKFISDSSSTNNKEQLCFIAQLIYAKTHI